MTERDNESKPDIEDKDYGFPFVEVTPIKSSVSSEEKEDIEIVEESIASPEKIKPIVSENPKPAEPTIKFKSEKKVTKKPKSQLSLLLSLVFLIVIILSSIAYFLYYIPESDTTLETTNPIISEKVITEKPLTDGDVNQELEVVEDIGGEPETDIEASANTPVPEVVTAEIILVNKRGEIPLYNVIVASSPNERIARAEAQKMVDKGITAWIIFPFGNTNNYRISVGRYEDLESATKAMETTRVELNESSWILKY